jgi:hypothetical protein
VAAWWRENRQATPDLFHDELEAAKRELATLPPTPGLVYETVRGKVIRRLLLPKTEQHVYFSIEESARMVVIHSVWGARRGRGPNL